MNSWTVPASLLLSCWVPFASANAIVLGQDPYARWRGLSQKQLDDRFSNSSPRVGDYLPTIQLATIRGKKVELRDSCFGNPTLIVTGSLTCPKTRTSIEGLRELKMKFGDQLQIVFLYVIEAHPIQGLCPYKGIEDVTEANRADNILFQQPATFSERVLLAQQLTAKYELESIASSVLVDTMDNLAWRALGESPNVALLVDGNDRVVHRQGWLNGDKLHDVIQNAVKENQRSRNKLDWVPVDLEYRGGQSRGQEMHPKQREVSAQLRKLKIDRERLDALLSKQPASELEKLLTQVPDMVDGVLSSGAHNQYTYTLLETALMNRKLEHATVLLRAGANIQLKVANHSPMSVAVDMEYIEGVRFLLEHGASIDLEKSDHQRTIHQNAMLHAPDIAKLLQSKVKALDFLARCHLGDIEFLKKELEENPSSAFSADALGANGLAYAIAGNQERVVDEFLRRKLGRFLNGVVNESPVHYAVANHNAKMVTKLAKGGLSVELGDRRSPPIFQAIRNNDLQVVQALVQAGARLTSRNETTLTPLQFACDQSPVSLEIIQELAKDKSTLDLATKDYYLEGCGETDDHEATEETALHFAAKRLRPDALAKLIQAGANRELKNAADLTPLAVAVLHTLLTESDDDFEQGLRTIQSLVKNGANVDCTDSDGDIIRFALTFPKTVSPALAPSAGLFGDPGPGVAPPGPPEPDDPFAPDPFGSDTPPAETARRMPNATDADETNLRDPFEPETSETNHPAQRSFVRRGHRERNGIDTFSARDVPISDGSKRIVKLLEPNQRK